MVELDVDVRLFHQYMRGICILCTFVLLLLAIYQFTLSKKRQKSRIYWIQPLCVASAILLGVRAADPIGVFGIIPCYVEFFCAYEVGLLLLTQGWIYVCINAEIHAKIPGQKNSTRDWVRKFSRIWPKLCTWGLLFASLCVIICSVLTAILPPHGGEASRVSGAMHIVGSVMLTVLLVHYYTQTSLLERELNGSERVESSSADRGSQEDSITLALLELRKTRRIFLGSVFLIYGLWGYQVYEFLFLLPPFPGRKSMDEYHALSYLGYIALILCTYLIVWIRWRPRNSKPSKSESENQGRMSNSTMPSNRRSRRDSLGNSLSGDDPSSHSKSRELSVVQSTHSLNRREIPALAIMATPQSQVVTANDTIHDTNSDDQDSKRDSSSSCTLTRGSELSVQSYYRNSEHSNFSGAQISVPPSPISTVRKGSNQRNYPSFTLSGGSQTLPVPPLSASVSLDNTPEVNTRSAYIPSSRSVSHVPKIEQPSAKEGDRVGNDNDEGDEHSAVRISLSPKSQTQGRQASSSSISSPGQDQIRRFEMRSRSNDNDDDPQLDRLALSPKSQTSASRTSGPQHSTRIITSFSSSLPSSSDQVTSPSGALSSLSDSNTPQMIQRSYRTPTTPSRSLQILLSSQSSRGENPAQSSRGENPAHQVIANAPVPDTYLQQPVSDTHSTQSSPRTPTRPSQALEVLLQHAANF